MSWQWHYKIVVQAYMNTYYNSLGMQTDNSNMVQASLEEALEGILETTD